MLSGSIEWEHHPGEEFVLRFKPPLSKLMPDEARQHARLARKEVLLAIRSMLDAAIERVDESEKNTEKRRAKIKVE